MKFIAFACNFRTIVFFLFHKLPAICCLHWKLKWQWSSSIGKISENSKSMGKSGSGCRAFCIALLSPHLTRNSEPDQKNREQCGKRSIFRSSEVSQNYFWCRQEWRMSPNFHWNILGALSRDGTKREQWPGMSSDVSTVPCAWCSQRYSCNNLAMYSSSSAELFPRRKKTGLLPSTDCLILTLTRCWLRKTMNQLPAPVRHKWRVEWEVELPSEAAN